MSFGESYFAPLSLRVINNLKRKPQCAAQCFRVFAGFNVRLVGVQPVLPVCFAESLEFTPFDLVVFEQRGNPEKGLAQR
jgi:hypothetical protein